VHFAGHIVVPESVSDPFKYYQNNVVGSLKLLQCCIDNDIRHFVFSSSAAVYGMPDISPVTESMPTQPINPYGNTKLITEMSLQDAAGSFINKRDFNFIALRYFNAAGAAFSGELGQATPNATHLIKVACEAACGARDGMAIYGEDYPTPDGSCVRDYIHIEDLAQAHIDALAYLEKGGTSHSLNCGYGQGYSVKQVIDTVKKVSGVDFPVSIEGRRAGDPPELIADNSKIREVLGWMPKFNSLETICETAYSWEKTWQVRKHQS
jgi:UDP-glucose 4-epimerase